MRTGSSRKKQCFWQESQGTEAPRTQPWCRGSQRGKELKDSYRGWCSPDTGLGHIFSIPVRAVCRLPRTGCSWGVVIRGGGSCTGECYTDRKVKAGPGERKEAGVLCGQQSQGLVGRATVGSYWAGTLKTMNFCSLSAQTSITETCSFNHL